MNRFFSISIISISLLLLASCEYFTFYTGKGKPYVNDQYNFAVRYPDLWSVNDTGLMDSAVFFINRNHKGEIKPTVNIHVQNSTGLTLLQYVNRSKRGMEEGIDQIGYKLKKFIGEGKTRLGNLTGYYLSYLYDQADRNYRGKALYYVEADKAYILFFTAAEKDFNAYEEDFNIIINSFKLKK